MIAHTPLNVLEIGCGAGGILDYFRQKGHRVKGIDLGEEYLKYGKEVHKLNLDKGTLDELITNQKPDIIIYSHVLEHVLNLNEEIKLIKRIMHQDTIVYIEVPGIKEIHKNYESNILKYFQNAHTCHFSLETLTNLMNMNGFELILGDQFVKSVFKYTGKNKEFVTDYQAVSKYISRTELRFHCLRLWYSLHRKLKRLIFIILDCTGTRNLVRKANKLFNNK